MATSNGNPEDRNTVLTRFVIMYIICILCALIPIYYLFNIPGTTIRKLSVSEYSIKSQQKKLDRYKVIISELDKYISEDKIAMEYHNTLNNLYAFAKDSVDEKNLYKSLYIKISYLYEKIEKDNELGFGKANFEKLKTANAKLEIEKKQLEVDLNDCNKLNISLMLNK